MKLGDASLLKLPFSLCSWDHKQMDEELKKKLDSVHEGVEWVDSRGTRQYIHYSLQFAVEGDKRFVKVTTPSGQVIHHQLKCFEELLAPGQQYVHIDWGDDKYLALLSSVESAISRHYRCNRKLKDSEVLSVLRGLIDDLFTLRGELREEIQLNFLFFLSLQEYTYGEVLSALKKVLNSVKTHRDKGDRRSYLRFIVNFI